MAPHLSKALVYLFGMQILAYACFSIIGIPFSSLCRKSGFYLAVSHHKEMPLMSQRAIQVSPGTDVRIAISPTIVSADKNRIKRFDPINRTCYFEEEFHFQYLPDEYFQYQMSNCLFEVIMKKTIDGCNCHPLPIESLKFNLSRHSCYGKKLSCEKKYISK